MQQHECELDGEASAADGMQRKVEQVEVRVGHDAAQQLLVAPQQPAVRQPGEEKHDRDEHARQDGGRQQAKVRTREPPALDDVEHQPHHRRHRQRRQQQVERGGTR